MPSGGRGALCHGTIRSCRIRPVTRCASTGVPSIDGPLRSKRPPTRTGGSPCSSRSSRVGATTPTHSTGRWTGGARSSSRARSGWLGGTYGITDDDEFVGVVRFDSRASAEANSARPEQGAWWEETARLFDGEASFHDCDDVTMMLDGGSDDAGFVQVIQGRLSDPEQFRHMMEGPMDMLHEARPDIIGGTIAIARRRLLHADDVVPHRGRGARGREEDPAARGAAGDGADERR